MTLESYASFLRILGIRSIAAGDLLWVSVGAGFYQAFPVHRPVVPSAWQVRQAMWKGPAVGVRFCAPTDFPLGGSSFVYLIDDRGYDLHHLSANLRSKVRRGLARCRVEPIQEPETLEVEGWPLNVETLTRQGRFRVRTARERWKRVAQSLGKIEGLQAWGARVDGELASLAVTFRVQDCVNLLILRSTLQHRWAYPNNALVFTIVREAFAQPGVTCVSYGEESILGLDSLDVFKTGMGFERRPVRQVLILHPLLRWAKPLVKNRVVEATASRYPDNLVLRKIVGAARWL
ncbi:MAG: GNAT family N-acetyltransferase [candidate division KSB1 bacterium]|nr:GNAT family N-acetyltransferase [candidate division KSB1 bacterium]